MAMKRVMLLPIYMLLSLSLFSAVIPRSAKVGLVDVRLEEGSVEKMCHDAFREEFTLRWLEKYAREGEAFAVLYARELSAILPMKNLVVGKYDGLSLSLYSLDGGPVVTVIVKEGRIAALRFRYPVEAESENQ